MLTPVFPLTAVNQAPFGGTLYPFLVACDLARAVLDAYLAYPGAECAAALPLSLTLTGTGGAFAVALADADDAALYSFDSADAAATPWGSRTVYQWVHADGAVFRLVVRDDLLAAGDGVLDPRTVTRLPPRVTSISVGELSFGGTAVDLEGGFNAELVVTEMPRVDGGRVVTRVTVNLEPGSGDGPVPGCEEAVPVLRRINGVGPDKAGNIRLDALGCYRHQRPVAVTTPDGVRTATVTAPATLALSNDCQPCCRCDYYVRVYKGLRRVWFDWVDTATAAESARDKYAANKERWEASADCRTARPSRLVILPEAGCTVQVGGTYCNGADFCLREVELRFTVQRYSNGVEVPAVPGAMTARDVVLAGSTSSAPSGDPYPVGGEYPVFKVTAFYANPQDVTAVQFRLCPTEPCQPGDSLKVTLTVHVAPLPPGRTLPQPTVPPPVDAIWVDTGDVPATPARAVAEAVVPLNPEPRKYPCDCGVTE